MPITVTLPDGSHATSTHTGYLNLPSLPSAARRVDIFPDWIGSLLSIGVLCDCGLTATYTATTVTITDDAGRVVLSGHRTHPSKLWLVNINNGPISPSISSTTQPSWFSAAVVTEAKGTQAQIVAYYSAVMCSPSVSTLTHAVRQGWVALPGLSADMISRYPPSSTATSKGHMDLDISGKRSTKSKDTDTSSNDAVATFSPSAEEESSDDWYPPTAPRQSRILKCITKIIPSSELRHTDLTGRFPVRGISGKQYFMIMICANYIHAELMDSRCAGDYVKAYSRGTDFFESHGVTPSYERMDNETSDLLKSYCYDHNPRITIEPVAPGNHRGNKAERAIRTWKNHFTSALCTADPNLPLHMFEQLVEQAELTLNLLRGSPFSPHVSAWHALRGPFSYAKTPLAPPGIKIVCFETPAKRLSWSTHGVDGFYVGPALDHYRCFKVYITSTRATRVTGQLSWHPPPLYTMPGLSPVDDAINCFSALRTSITNLIKTHPRGLSSASPNVPDADNIHAALDTLALLFTSPTRSATAPPSCLAAPQQAEDPVVSQRVPHRAPPAPAQRVPTQETDTPDLVTPPLTTPTGQAVELVPDVHVAPLEPPDPSPPSQDAPTTAPVEGKRNRPPIDYKTLHRDGTTQPPYSRSKISRDKKAEHLFANHVLGPDFALYDLGAARDIGIVDHAASVLLSNTYTTDVNRKKLKIGATRSRWDSSSWRVEESKEINRLIEVTHTMSWMDASSKPADRKASYYNPQVSVKVNALGETIRRVRGTYGGDGSDYTGDRSSWTADMQTIKILFNAIVSENADYCTADIGDFYLGSTLERDEYMWLSRAQVPDDIQERYGEKIIWVGDKTMVRITKGIYGLPQAGRLAFEKLSRLLKRHDYTACPNSPCLFKHATNGVAFTLVVDDFAIKYPDKAAVEHLFTAIREEYRLEVDWAGSKYIGMSVDYNKKARWLDIWMPGYVSAALKRFGVPHPSKPTHGPMHFNPITYGKQQQLVEVDESPLASEAQARFIREVVGVFMYYARAVDITMPCPLSKLSIGQAKPTTQTYDAILHFLQYAASYPNASIRYRPSAMRLIIHSDASYLSESNARSRAGGIHFLSTNGDPLQAPRNGAIDVISSIIPTVVSAASEAEIAALFINGQAAVAARNTLADLGYPQEATPMITDNTTANGIANNTVRLKRSKAIDMRYHWVRDRVQRGEYSVSWGPGVSNDGDFFTKIHPASHYRAVRQNFVKDKPP